MGLVFKHGVLFFLALTTWSHQLGWGIQIEINPETYDGIIPTDVNISCRPDQADTSTKDVVVIEVSKDGGKPIVILRHNSQITLSPGLDPRFRAEGHISSTQPRSSYLLVTLSHPKNEDSGTFSCLMYYLDQSGLLQEDRARGNLTVNDPDVTKAMTYLLDKVSVLERRLTTREDKATSLEKTVTDQGGEVTSLEKTVTDQAKQLQEQKGKVSSEIAELFDKEQYNRQQIQNLTDKVSSEIAELFDMEQYNRQHIQNLTDKDSFVSAFSAGYDSKDNFTNGNTLVFNQSILDVGHDYNTTTGVFTAPRHGLYVFHLVVLSHGYNWEIDVNLDANGHTVATLVAVDKDYNDQSSIGTVVTLQAGDQVKPIVRYISGGNVVHPDDHFSIFSGYLIQLL